MWPVRLYSSQNVVIASFSTRIFCRFGQTEFCSWDGLDLRWLSSKTKYSKGRKGLSAIWTQEITYEECGAVSKPANFKILTMIRLRQPDFELHAFRAAEVLWELPQVSLRSPNFCDCSLSNSRGSHSGISRAWTRHFPKYRSVPVEL